MAAAKNDDWKIKDTSYYQIAGWMVNPKGMNLSGLELQLYAIIYGFSQAEGTAYTGSLVYLSQFTNSSISGVKKALGILVEKGFLLKEEQGYNKFSYRAVVVTEEQKEDESLSSSYESLSSSYGSLSDSRTNNNINNISINGWIDKKEPVHNKGYQRVKDDIASQIELDCLRERFKDPGGKAMLDEIYEIMIEVIRSRKSSFSINGDDVAGYDVKKRFRKLDYDSICYAIDILRHNNSRVKNIKSYLITTLYNAPATVANYYTNQANADYGA